VLILHCHATSCSHYHLVKAADPRFCDIHYRNCVPTKRVSCRARHSCAAACFNRNRNVISVHSIRLLHALALGRTECCIGNRLHQYHLPVFFSVSPGECRKNPTSLLRALGLRWSPKLTKGTIMCCLGRAVMDEYGAQKRLERNLLQCYFVHHLKSPGVEPGSQRWKASAWPPDSWYSALKWAATASFDIVIRRNITSAVKTAS
jgi:hypothetical protein